ncbi:MAG: ribonuclease R [Chitinophagales bacterium]
MSKKKKKDFIPRKKKEDKSFEKKKDHKGDKKKKKSSNNGNADIVLSVIKAMGKDADLKKLFPKLLRKLTQEEIIVALNELDHEGVLRIEQKGTIKLLNMPKAHKGDGKNSRYFYGTVDIARSGDAFITVEGLEKDVYVPKKYVKNAQQGDEVKLRITGGGRRPEGEILEITKHSRDTFLGRVDVLERFAFFIADENRLKSDVFVPLDALNGAKHHDRVIVRVTNWNSGTKNPVGEVLEVLDGSYSSDLDMKRILMENGFSIDFPKACYQELARVSEKISREEISKRLDYRDVLTFTIDPVDAKDFDDAISIRKLDNGNLEVGVHIADVSHYIPEGSELDKEAERRATSVYLPDRVCPMLPEKLSNVLCSLRPNEDKLTFSTIFEMDDKFNVKHVSIGKTVIHSNRRFTYEEVQEVLETGQGDYVEELKTLLAISKKIREKRFKKGAIAFEKAEVRFKLDENGKPLGIVLKIRKDAHLLVEDFMLLANETVAKYGSRLHNGKQAKPFVYRVHDTPDPAKLELFAAVVSRFGYVLKFEEPKQVSETLNNLLKKVEGRPEQNVVETMAIRTMAKAEYTTENIGHYGLAMEHYTHFTSPIRRYPDVMVHRLIHKLLTHSDAVVDKDELEKYCKNSSLMERKAMDAEREATKYKQIEFLQDKIGEEFDGLISGVIARGVFVEMIDNKCEGMISTEMLGDEDFIYEENMVRLVGARSKRKFQLGDKVRVRVLSADIILRRIDLELVG